MYPFIFRAVFARLDAETAHHLVMPVIRLLGLPGELPAMVREVNGQWQRQ